MGTTCTAGLPRAPGNKASLLPLDRSNLGTGTGTVKVKVEHKNGRSTTTTLHNTVKPADKFSVSLKVGKRVHGKRSLTIATESTKLVKRSSASLT